MSILTVADAYSATREVDRFAHQIRNKVVIEIGAGVGFLALEMARFAKHVYAIEADPAWTWVFTNTLYEKKPPNLTWIFGTAESVAPVLRGDVAVVYTRSAVGQMTDVAKIMCPKIILGPFLSLAEHYPDTPPEVLQEAEDFASHVTANDIKSRRGFRFHQPLE